MSGPAAEQSTKFEPDAPVSDGRLTWGRFHTPFATVNLDELRVSRPRAWKWFRLKEWQALQFGNVAREVGFAFDAVAAQGA